ncbi:MAG: GDP-mannose 4,6-dehydratase, partial [Bacteroidetes bacterium]|nr:GDP-mannose 4,6-dehydratase [Bacteroidota bacterium]
YNKTIQSDTISLYGTGKESRDFIYILDLIAIVDIIIHKAKFEGEVYNVANGEEIQIKDTVDIFIKECGWKGNVTFSGKDKTGDPLNWKADIQKIRSLGYKQKYNFIKGVNNYCQWLKGLK